MTKDKHVSIKIPVSMYNDMQKLRQSLKVQDDSKTIRFCIIFTLATIDKLDENKITEALALAFGETFFNNKK